MMLEPTTGTVVGSLAIGNEPGLIAKSDNDQYLYVSINTNRSIRRVDLASQTAGLEFALGSNAFNEVYYLEDMAVLPDNPNSIAVSRQMVSGTSSGFTHEAVAVYDNGIPRPNTGRAESHFYSDVIEFGDDPSILFAHNSGAVGFNRLALNEQGVTFLDSDPELLGNFTVVGLESAEGLLYSTSGKVINPLTRTSSGQIQGITSGADVLFDAPTRRIFYLQSDGKLLAFEAGTFIPLGSMNIPGVSGMPASLTRWGDDGLAFRTSTDQLFILRTSLIPTNEPADLRLDLVSQSPSAMIGEDYEFTLQINNEGPSAASAVVLTNNLPEGSTVSGVALSQGTWSASSGNVVCDLGQIASGSSAEVTVTLKPGVAGLLSFTSAANGAVLDRTNSNNRVSWIAWVGTTNEDAFQSGAAIGVNDIVADPLSSRIYASISSSNAQLANSVIWINPTTGKIGQPIPIGANPNRLAISSDGCFLYAGLDGENKVQQLNLTNETLGLQFALGSGQKAEAILVSPTNSGEVVVYRSLDGKVAIYNDGVKRSQKLSGKKASDIGGLNLLAYSETTSELYVCAGYYSNVPFYRVAVSGAGLALADSQPGHQSQTTEWKSDGGLLFYNRGMVVNPQTRRVTAVMPVAGNPLVEPDVNSGRVFYLTQTGANWTLRAFDLEQAIEVASMPVSGFSGTPKKLIRWGTDGFAICTTTGQLIILQGFLLPVGPAADLALTQTASTLNSTTNDVVTFTLSLTNRGPAALNEIIVTQAFSLNVTNLNIFTNPGTASITNNKVVWRLESLEQGAGASATMSLRPVQGGTLNASAVALHSGADPFWANNVALNAVNVSEPGISNVLELQLNTRELVYDSTRDLLYVSIPASNGFFGNLVAVINPETGTIEDSMLAGSEPNQLALSGDAKYLYVSLDGNMGVQRFNLQTHAPDIEFQFATNDIYYANDLEVQPGDGETIAVSLCSFNFAPLYPSDVWLYDSGIRRPLKGGPSRGISFAQDGSCLFGHVSPGTSASFVRMWTGPSGFELTDGGAGFSQPPGELKFSNGRLYSYSGQVAEPYVPARIGTFGISGPFAVDQNTGRIFYLAQTGTNWNLRAYGIGNFQLVATQTIANVRGTPSHLIRCGAGRLAFRTSSNQVFIVQSALVPTNFLAEANLRVSQEVRQDFDSATETLRFVITVANQGFGTASNVLLAIKPPLRVGSLALQLPQGTSTNSGENYLCNLGDMDAGQILEVRLNAVITNTATYSNLVSVSASTPDPNLADNQSLLSVDGLFFQRVDSVRAVNLNASDLAFDAARGRLLVGVVGTNRIAWLDPETGSLKGDFEIAMPAQKLLISDDSQYLYVSFANTSLVQRVSLSSNSVDSSFTLPGGFPPNAMAALPGSPHSLIVSFWNGTNVVTAIFDDGNPRPEQILGRQYKLLAASSDGNTVFGYDNNSTGGASPDVFRMNVSANGITAGENGPSDTPWGNNEQMSFASGRLIFANGNVINPATLSEETGFTLSDWGYGFASVESLDRIAFLTHPSAYYDPVHMTIFEFSTRQLLGDFNLGSIPTSYGSLTYCGADRFALRKGNQIVFIRSSAIPSADLQLHATSTGAEMRPGQSVSLQIIVSNVGPAAVSEVVLTNRLPAGVNIFSNSVSQGSVTTDGQLMIASLGTLSANGTATLSFSISPSGDVDGWVTNSAEVISSATPDPFAWNNRADLNIRILPPDRDDDGLPDEWEISFELDPDNPADAFADSDGDGHSNMQEFLAGTIPRDAASVFRVLHVEIQDNSIAIEFSTVPEKRYTIQTASAVPSAVWINLIGDIEGTGEPVTVSVPAAPRGSIQFLRVQVQSP